MLKSKLIITSLIVSTLSTSGISTNALSSNSDKETYDGQNKGSSSGLSVVTSDSIENNNIASATPEPEVHAILLIGLMLLGITCPRKRNTKIMPKLNT